MGKSNTYEHVKQYIESEGYTLLSDTYINSKKKLSVRCNKGHEYDVTFSSFKISGRRCRKCSVDNQKNTYEYVKSYIENEGYTLLSDTYENAKKHLLIKCPNGHINHQKWNNFKSGCRCNICGIHESANKQKLYYEYVKQYIESEGYILLSDTYINAREHLLLMCPNGHEYSVSFCNFTSKSKRRCKQCSDDKLRLTYEHVKQFIENENYTLLSDTYSNSRVKLLIRCGEGHEYNTTFNRFQSGKRCPMCSEKTSKGERDMSLFIESLGIPIVKNDRTQIINPSTGYNLELDVWIPSINKAIEYNGTYWHSLPSKVIYDKIKSDKCKELGINLLIVNEDSWVNYKEMEMDRIRNFIYG